MSIAPGSTVWRLLARAWISGFWRHLKGAPVLSVLPVRFRASRPFGLAKSPISGAQKDVGFASLASWKVFWRKREPVGLGLTLLILPIGSNFYPSCYSKGRFRRRAKRSPRPVGRRRSAFWLNRGSPRPAGPTVQWTVGKAPRRSRCPMGRGSGRLSPSAGRAHSCARPPACRSSPAAVCGPSSGWSARRDPSPYFTYRGRGV